ncbi:MAG TPA: GNAT family N-acetyltransferase [Candidatus Corynebacterium avicola]|uniref:GNAT family N-acetyltransferase n=1 Tax=Candidatus Corynebacterium avicola TaxID=2838527 RepID=A0A9D1RSY3_9CORY|nr:GNAT family N-acetyltransferase [Candidatus Corynebacterium avicola]
MQYPRTAHLQRRMLWSNCSVRPGFASAIALEHPVDVPPEPADRSQTAVGVAFGYLGDDSTWWYQEVHRGLRGGGLSRDEATSFLSDYDEVSEVHVRPGRQGHGVGRRLLGCLLDQLTSGQALLSTPEVPDEDNAAWTLYRATGFRDVLRNFRFGSDPRPFGVLALDRGQRTMS